MPSAGSLTNLLLCRLRLAQENFDLRVLCRVDEIADLDNERLVENSR
jgi:hypothetical protein